MSNDKIAKDEVRGNISFKIDLSELNNFELLIDNANLMALILSKNISGLLRFLDTVQHDDELKTNLQEVNLLSTLLLGLVQEVQLFLVESLKSS